MGKIDCEQNPSRGRQKAAWGKHEKNIIILKEGVAHNDCAVLTKLPGNTTLLGFTKLTNYLAKGAVVFTTDHHNDLGMDGGEWPHVSAAIQCLPCFESKD